MHERRRVALRDKAGDNAKDDQVRQETMQLTTAAAPRRYNTAPEHEGESVVEIPNVNGWVAHPSLDKVGRAELWQADGSRASDRGPTVETHKRRRVALRDKAGDDAKDDP